MSQNSVVLPTTGTVSGLTMTQDTNNALDTLRTNFSGPSLAVSSAEAWQLFANTTANTLNLMSADGTTFIPLFTINQSSYQATPSNLSQSFTPQPQGRLTLSSNLPVMTADIIAATAIYYTNYIGNILPVYNGSLYSLQSFTQLTLTLNSTNHPNAQVFDIYASIQSSSLVLSAMAWGSNTARTTSSGGKTGTGNATITMKNGLWVNNAAISSGDSFNGVTGYSIPQYQGTYLGTFYTTANGQTSVQFKPSASSGGTNNVVGLWNAYNRCSAASLCRDSSSAYTYSAAVWRAADASNSNRVSWVDGLQQTSIKAFYINNGAPSVAGDSIYFGVSLNSASNSPDFYGQATAPTGTLINNIVNVVIEENFPPQLGFNYIQAMENAASNATVTINYNGVNAGLMLNLEY